MYSAYWLGALITVLLLCFVNAIFLSLYLVRVAQKLFSGILQVRHPNILSFPHSTEAEVFDGSTAKHTIYIVTEPVMPLSEKLKELKLEGTQRYNELSLLNTLHHWHLKHLF